MFVLPVFNLFLYNVLVGYIDWQCRNAIDAITVFAVFLPRVRRLFSHLFGYQKSLQEFNDALWSANLYVNFLVLLPTFFQNDLLKVLLAVILTWNICVCQRMLFFFVRLMWMMWWSNLCWGYYVLLVSFGVLMNSIHLGLIYGTLKLPQVQSRRRSSNH